jgi:cellobiose phosphorylase
MVDPCIPKEWDGYSVTRVFLGDTYQITVRNPKHINKGVVGVVMDGIEIKGNILPTAGDGRIHTVEVVLG